MSGHRKRGGSFHVDEGDGNEDNDHEVQFVTPYYDESNMPEPLDLSKLCLDDDDDDMFEKSENEDAEAQEVATRGRSRSRSVHENDLGAPGYIPNADTLGLPPGSDASDGGSQDGSKGNKKNGNGNGDDKTARKGGPLQHREVQALKKGLEEATQSLNRNQNREDEEERMAADAEKRKRLLLANNLATNNSAEPGRRVKLLMLGDSGVGKSSLIMRWTMDTFSPSLVSTVGVNFKSRKVNVNNELMQVQVWDTAGQEQFHKITTSYYKGAQGIMLVYDVTDPSSLANIEYWIKNIKSHASDAVQVALIGNKTDLRAANTDPSKKCCDTERGQEIALKFGIPFFETSAKESMNVDIAFLTLVEHIADSSAGAHSPGTATGVHAGAGGATGLNGNGAASSSGLAGKAPAAEKGDTKNRLLGTIKRQTSAMLSNNKSSPPPPPGAGGAPATGGAADPSGVDKEKCAIS